MLPLPRCPALLAGALALALGLAGPAPAATDRGQRTEARGQWAAKACLCPLASVLCPLAAAARPAIEWNWREFLKYWQRQAGKTSSIVGIVLLVAAGATLIIISSKSRT